MGHDIIIQGDEKPIGEYSYEEFKDMATLFHNYPAPGLMLGGYMVEAAKACMSEDVLYEIISETSWCLPDAAQMLTPCTMGNGWLKVVNFGRYAVTLYNKYNGEGVRVSLCPEKMEQYEELTTWLYKRKPKAEQDTEKLQREIALAGASICNISPVKVSGKHLIKRSKGTIADCPVCGEPYPQKYGSICRACQGESPYEEVSVVDRTRVVPSNVSVVPLEEAVGKTALHDMTEINPGKSKGPLFRKGHVFEVGDLCRLQRIGKNSVYVVDGDVDGSWVHENQCATHFANKMAGEFVKAGGSAKEGKVELISQEAGMLVVDTKTLEAFNHIPGVMAACRKGFSLVKKGVSIAGTRAIPLYLERAVFDTAIQVLGEEPVFSVKPLRAAKAGVLITGNEVFDGLIQDKFEGIIETKLAALGSSIEQVIICQDDRSRIADAAKSLVKQGCDLIITTAGLSVDPDDVTRAGLVDAGLKNILYGAPVLPGAMTLIGSLQGVQTLGVPACALFHKHTSLDIILPRLLAGLAITRSDLAAIANGGMCMDCSHCSFPKCAFGK
ncbi:FmdE family protein [Halodesulfovibrio marinisediminis]|uniref:Formylmethanofuran dehydrogenase subunit E n=1 Tax=Halodesulfovibrio marinisediminis DSM 17456 TaxID=1121457 RepID=A0A1N6ECT6_9BACT|nr:FmdE family protein [Halodesulfovibrio marinisediminis]SIN80781.1 formylmethanofuran dehydrogenase subunit E [Halodesulfovibrio marinisediminis DSM 17456]